MQMRNIHIATKGCFGSIQDYTIRGAYLAVEK